MMMILFQLLSNSMSFMSSCLAIQAQLRYGDAIHMYQLALKATSQSMSGNQFSNQQLLSRRISCICEYLALACMKHSLLPDALRHALRGLHIDPSSLTLWYNQCYLREEYAIVNLRKQPPVSRDVEAAIADLVITQRIFSYCEDKPCVPSQLMGGEQSGPVYDAKKVSAHVGFCNVSL